MKTSRPCLSRLISPARSSSLRCLVTAFSATSNGSATSVNRAGPECASREMIARREGCDMAVRTSVNWSMVALDIRFHAAVGHEAVQPLLKQHAPALHAPVILLLGD